MLFNADESSNHMLIWSIRLGDSQSNSRGGYLANWLRDAAIDHGIKLYAPCEPTFPSSGSYLDLCFADARLEIGGLSDGRLKTLDYDSDHRAFCFHLGLNCTADLLIDVTPQKDAWNFKGTDWRRFRLYLKNNHNINIPANRNLTNEEIDDYLSVMNDAICEAMQRWIPRFTSVNSTEKYTNNKINKLQRDKAMLITCLNYLRRSCNPNLRATQEIIVAVREFLQAVKYEINKEFSKAVNKYWANKARRINYKCTDSFFPELNRMFR
ncbi:hypothetical protein TKK_0012282 [Trichogramma kaykai]